MPMSTVSTPRMTSQTSVTKMRRSSGWIPNYLIENFLRARCSECGKVFEARTQDMLGTKIREHTLWHIAAPYSWRD